MSYPRRPASRSALAECVAVIVVTLFLLIMWWWTAHLYGWSSRSWLALVFLVAILAAVLGTGVHRCRRTHRR